MLFIGCSCTIGKHLFPILFLFIKESYLDSIALQLTSAPPCFLAPACKQWWVWFARLLVRSRRLSVGKTKLYSGLCILTNLHLDSLELTNTKISGSIFLFTLAPTFSWWHTLRRGFESVQRREGESYLVSASSLNIIQVQILSYFPPMIEWT